MKEEKIVRFFEEIGLAKGIANIKKFEQEIMIPEIIKAKKKVFDDIEKLWEKCKNDDLKVMILNDLRELKKHHLGK